MKATENSPKAQEEPTEEPRQEQNIPLQENKPRYVPNRHDRRRAAAIARRNKKAGKR